MRMIDFSFVLDYPRCIPWKIEYPEPPAATIKGIRKIPNIGHLLNKFIDYLDRMPDEVMTHILDS